FFQAEDGIRDKLVTGVQTCALPIYRQEGAGAEGVAQRDADAAGGDIVDDGAPGKRRAWLQGVRRRFESAGVAFGTAAVGFLEKQIGRASCRASEGARVRPQAPRNEH